MRKYICLLCLINLFFMANNSRGEKDEIVIESRLFKGIRAEGKPGPQVVISSFSEPFFVPVHPSYLEEENKSISYLKNELNTIYQLNTVELLATNHMIWDGKKRKLNETILLEELIYPINFSPQVLSKKNVKLRIEISKFKGAAIPLSAGKAQIAGGGQSGILKNTEKNILSEGAGEKLLDTEIIMNFNEPVVLGFPSNGHPYFLSLLVIKKGSGEIPEVFSRERIEVNVLNPPRAVHKVTPVYPQNCREAKIEGEVILKVSTDKAGNVEDARVLRPAHPDLDKAAEEALKQWKYEPVLKDGKPVPVVFAVKVDFKLREPLYSQKAEPSSTDQKELEIILKKCADYCKRLADVSLFFVCQERITEEIYRLPIASIGADQSDFLIIYQVAGRNIRIRKNVYVYDYQLIRKDDEIKESRILIEENGKEKQEKDAPLKTKLFYHKNIIFGPIGLLSAHRQQFYEYKIIKEEKLKGEKAIVVEAFPKPGQDINSLCGKIWVKKSNFSILKIEWDQRSVENYDVIERTAKIYRAEPKITFAAEYAFEKNGIRFPSSYSVNEAYIRRGAINVKSKTAVVYTDYKFFTVDTEVIYKLP